MKQQSKFTSKEESEQAMQAQSAKSAGLEFETVEQLLRHDAGQVTVPTAVAQRLQNSMGKTEKPHVSWWRRWLG